MTARYIRSPACFLTRKRKHDIVIEPVAAADFKGWAKKQGAAAQAAMAQAGFEAKDGQVFALSGKDGTIHTVAAGAGERAGFYDFAVIVKKLPQILSDSILREASFSPGGKGTDFTACCIGWALGCYRFDLYKEDKTPLPRLVMPQGTDKQRVIGMAEAIGMLRDLVNMPANDLGPAELEQAARELANGFDAALKTVEGAALKREFPLVFAVGDSSPRRPRLIDLQWGNPKHPRVTLVGKGVCFDTGGLDIKPSQYMALMKKDMGGAAHALALARLVMGMKLPVRLRVLIPAVENAVSGDSFRPGDIFKSRKGLAVENTNTDAEGRLVLADALTCASEEKPDLIIDFATLTGSARAALGPDIPALFSNSDKLAEEMRRLSFKADDPVWPMPLWQGYRKTIESANGDLVNSAAVPGDLIYSALFLESFLVHPVDWIHLDIFAWENAGRPGRPKGGADTGLRAAFALLEKRYGKEARAAS